MAYMFCEKETEDRARVMLIYNASPPKEVLNNAKKKGQVMVEAEKLPKEQKKGKSALPYVNPKTGKFWYEYVDRPLTQEELNEEFLVKLDNLDKKMNVMMGNKSKK